MTRHKHNPKKRKKLFPIRLCSFKKIKDWKWFDSDTGKDLAVEVRDRHCIYPHCRAPASRCQVHHLNEWLIDRGFTDVEVLGLFCDAHHRHLHVEALIADLQPDRTVIIRIRSTGETIATATPVR